MHRERVRCSAELPPDVFAVVMATGICSIAADENHYRALSVLLAVLASLGLVVLGTTFGLFSASREFVMRLRDPDVALRLFTAAAACEVIGLRWVAHAVVLDVALALAAITWLGLAPLAIRDVRQRPRDELRAHAHGAWLLASVATSGLAGIIAAEAHRDSAWLSGVVVALWLLAIVIYVAVASMILWHVASRLNAGAEVPPDSWILMGALAALTLTGTRLNEAIPTSGWLESSISGLTLACWVVATLWIPVLLYAEAWQVNHHQGALRFRGAWWSVVFPLGMYSAATAALALIHHSSWMWTVSLVFFWDALAVWLVVGAGWISSALSRGQRPDAFLGGRR